MPATTTSSGQEIVVIGTRIPEYEKQLKACLAEHCQPDKDITATLALADAQFKAGAYEDARTTLLASRRRNARFAKTYPVAVANLHHANGLIAAHLGLADSEWASALDTISAMKAGLDDDDPRVYLERIELGDAYARAGRFQASATQYADIARRANKLGLADIEGIALLRTATLNTRLAEQDYSGFAPSARRSIAALLARREPALQPYLEGARQLSVLLAARAAPGEDLDRMVASYPLQPAGARSVMLYAPTIALTANSSASNRSVSDPNSMVRVGAGVTSTAMGRYIGQWIDVAFTVGVDGRVQDAHVARYGKDVAVKGDWAEQVVSAVAARRYALQAQPSRARERYTMTANLIKVTGSHMMGRSPYPRLVRAELDPEEPTPDVTS